MTDGVPPLGSLLGGRYRLVRLLGAGGMGVVFEADDETMARKVAVKVLRAQLLTSGPFVERLRREARAIASLRHPNVVEVYNLDVTPDLAFLAMELLQGEPLGAVLKNGPALPATEIAELGCSILEALATAHEAGLVHRDVKPDNVFLADVHGKRTVKLLDFGLVKSEGDTAALTATGTVLGTWQYMAPEQAHGLPVDGRADVYSTAACLYYALTGKRPYQAADMEASMFALSEVPAPALAERRPDVDPALCAVIERGLDKTVARRPTARELLTELRPFAGAEGAARALAQRGGGSETRVAVAAPSMLEACEPSTERTFAPVASGDTLTAVDVPVSLVATEPLVKPVAEIAAVAPAALVTKLSSAAPAAPVAPPAVAAPAAEIRAPRTVPLPPALLAAPRDAGAIAASPNRRLAILVVVALVLFAVGVLVGRTFLFR
jgi:tRNA A-37 threonylcarbamoyl transferase component Bud32